jgi:hypothetical protein
MRLRGVGEAERGEAARAAARAAYERGRRALGEGYVRKVAFDYCADAGDGERVEVCFPVWHCPRLRVAEGRRARLARALRRLGPGPAGPGHGRSGGAVRDVIDPCLHARVLDAWERAEALEQRRQLERREQVVLAAPSGLGAAPGAGSAEAAHAAAAEARSAFMWVPVDVRCRVDEGTGQCSARLLGPVPGLPPRAGAAALYDDLEAVLAQLLPLLAPLLPRALLANGLLQVVVKAQEYVLPPGASYGGRWHTEGFAENILCAGVYYVDVSEELRGGQLSFRPAVTAESAGGHGMREVSLREWRDWALQRDGQQQRAFLFPPLLDSSGERQASVEEVVGESASASESAIRGESEGARQGASSGASAPSASATSASLQSKACARGHGPLGWVHHPTGAPRWDAYLLRAERCALCFSPLRGTNDHFVAACERCDYAVCLTCCELPGPSESVRERVEELAADSMWAAYLRHAPVATGAALTFSNDVPRRFRALRNPSSEPQSRLLLKFLVVDPDRRLPSSSEVPDAELVRRALRSFGLQDASPGQALVLDFLGPNASADSASRALLRDAARRAAMADPPRFRHLTFRDTAEVRYHSGSVASYEGHASHVADTHSDDDGASHGSGH